MDSCTGPHMGDETAADYVRHAVDPMYPNGMCELNGTTENIDDSWKGVTAIDYLPAIETEPDDPLARWFKGIIGEAPASEKYKPKKHRQKFVAGSWPDPGKSPVLKGQWELTFEEVVPGSVEAKKTWKLCKNGESVTIRIYVAGSLDFRYTFNRFLAIGSFASTPTNPFQKGPSYPGHYSVQFQTTGFSRYIWLHYNVIFDVVGTDTTFNMTRLLKWLNRNAKKHTKTVSEKNFTQYLPPTEGITCSPLNPRIGETVTVTLEPAKNLRYDFYFEEGDGLRLIDETDKGLKFLALKDSENTLVVSAVDRETLLTASKRFRISIISN